MKINIYVQPGAKKSSFEGEFNNNIKIKIKSPPLDGKANDELISFISEKLGLAKKQVKLISGEKSRYKVIEIPLDMRIEDLITRLQGD